MKHHTGLGIGRFPYDQDPLEIVDPLNSIRDADSEQYVNIATSIGRLVSEKQIQYGDSVGKTGGILRILYPDGVMPFQYDDALLTVRILDKLCRIAQRKSDGRDLGGESPYGDIAGYGILGLAKDTGK